MSEQYAMLPTQAIFLVAVTIDGPNILGIFPRIILREEERKELSLKTIPIGGKDGEFISANIGDCQAVAIIREVPSFVIEQDRRDTFASFGFLIPKEMNPLPYQEVLQTVTAACKAKNIFNAETLMKLGETLHRIMNSARTCKLEIQVNPQLTIEVNLDEHVESMLSNIRRSAQTDVENQICYAGIISAEEALQREKNAFILDKLILKTVCLEGPISLDEIRRKALALEPVLGTRIDLEAIGNSIKKYIEQGLIVVSVEGRIS